MGCTVKGRSVSVPLHIIFVGPPNTDGCARDLRAFLQSCDELGVVVASHQTEGPATCLTVLGIEIDTCLMELRLPADKLHRLSALLAQWRGKRSGRREVIGRFAATRVESGALVHPPNL